MLPHGSLLDVYRNMEESARDSVKASLETAMIGLPSRDRSNFSEWRVGRSPAVQCHHEFVPL